MITWQNNKNSKESTIFLQIAHFSERMAASLPTHPLLLQPRLAALFLLFCIWTAPLAFAFSAGIGTLIRRNQSAFSWAGPSTSCRRRRRIALFLDQPTSSSLLSSSFSSSLQQETTETNLSSSVVDKSEQNNAKNRPLCFFRAPPHNKWRPRLELSDLSIGQELPNAEVVQELLDGKTGPKVFCEVGVGRCRIHNHHKNNPQNQPPTPRWKIVTAMLRLGPPSTKRSVASKRAARLRNKSKNGGPGFSVFVHKIRLDNDQLEVCLDRDEALRAALDDDEPRRVSVSSLQIGQQVTGHVIRVEPYGVLVDVGANRPGLLHILKVSEFLQHYIDKEEGLKEDAGLHKGAKVVLQVQENRQKRLWLDFTDQAKQTVQEIRAREEKAGKRHVVAVVQETNKQKELAAEKNKSSSSATTTTTTTTTTSPQAQGPKPFASTTSNQSSSSSSTSSTVSKSSSSYSSYSLSPEEEAAWAAFAAGSSSPSQSSQSTSVTTSDDNYDDDDTYDAYDEDRDIEDALGLGTY